MTEKIWKKGLDCQVALCLTMRYHSIGRIGAERGRRAYEHQRDRRAQRPDAREHPLLRAGGLLAPARRENKYRDYSEEDLETLLRIALLRSLGFARRDQAAAIRRAGLAAAMRERSAALESEGQRLLAARNVRRHLPRGDKAIPPYGRRTTSTALSRTQRRSSGTLPSRTRCGVTLPVPSTSRLWVSWSHSCSSCCCTITL